MHLPVFLLTAALAVSAPYEGRATQPRGAVTNPTLANCLVSLKHEVRVPAQEPGVLVMLDVRKLYAVRQAERNPPLRFPVLVKERAAQPELLFLKELLVAVPAKIPSREARLILVFGALVTVSAGGSALHHLAHGNSGCVNDVIHVRDVSQHQAGPAPYYKEECARSRQRHGCRHSPVF